MTNDQLPQCPKRTRLARVGLGYAWSTNHMQSSYFWSLVAPNRSEKTLTGWWSFRLSPHQRWGYQHRSLVTPGTGFEPPRGVTTTTAAEGPKTLVGPRGGAFRGRNRTWTFKGVPIKPSQMETWYPDTEPLAPLLKVLVFGHPPHKKKTSGAAEYILATQEIATSSECVDCCGCIRSCASRKNLRDLAGYDIAVVFCWFCGDGLREQKT